jgi:hypothetical protein
MSTKQQLAFGDVESATAKAAEKVRRYFEQESTWGSGRVIASDLLVLLEMVQDMNIHSNSGVGYGSRVTVFYRGAASAQTWWWRDRWDASRDNPAVRVKNIGDVRVEGESVLVTVEFVAGTREVVFDFATAK